MKKEVTIASLRVSEELGDIITGVSQALSLSIHSYIKHLVLNDLDQKGLIKVIEREDEEEDA